MLSIPGRQGLGTRSSAVLNMARPHFAAFASAHPVRSFGACQAVARARHASAVTPKRPALAPSRPWPTSIKCSIRGRPRSRTDAPEPSVGSEHGSDSRAPPPFSSDGADTEQWMDMYYVPGDISLEPKLDNIFQLGARNFRVELLELGRVLRRLILGEHPNKYNPPDCLGLTLSNSAVSAREEANTEARALIKECSPWMRFIYQSVCFYIDLAFDGRPVPRLWFLEVVARIPYFSYTSCLHLFSTLGWWRSPELMNIHHAEELNETYHLAVMEALGGDVKWSDRFTAFHASILYYWFLVLQYFASPAESYAFSHLLEMHAVDTYAQFVEENEEALRELPAPQVAHEYYKDFLYYFDEFHSVYPDTDGDSAKSEKRRPVIGSLLDVFSNILEDEREHVKTMSACRSFTKEGKRFHYKGHKLQSNSRSPKMAMSDEQRRAYWEGWIKRRANASERNSTKH